MSTQFNIKVGTAEEREWMVNATCRGMTSRMYPEDEDDGNAARVIIAKRICNGDIEQGTLPCPVRVECLNWALSRNETRGVWGGCSERERVRIRRRRQKDKRKGRKAS